MNIYQRHRKFYSRPIRLSKKQMKHPLEVIDGFFSAITLDEVRQDFADLLECALTTDNDQFAKAVQRASIVCTLEKIEELIEAAYLLNFKKK